MPETRYSVRHLIQVKKSVPESGKNNGSSTISESEMFSKTRKQVVRCPNRNRDVEVTYTVSGKWLSPRFEIKSGPAMFDSSQSCNRSCIGSLKRPPRYLPFEVNF